MRYVVCVNEMCGMCQINVCYTVMRCVVHVYVNEICGKCRRYVWYHTSTRCGLYVNEKITRPYKRIEYLMNHLNM